MLILLHYTTEIARFFHSNLGNVGLALLGIAAPAYAIDGNVLLERCTTEGNERTYAQLSCNNYVVGVIDGYTAAVASPKAPPHQAEFAIPAGVTGQQTVDIVVKYLREHPAERHVPASILIVVALRESFPAK